MNFNSSLFGIVFFCACAEPFGYDKHDLVGFRIAAMKTDDFHLSASIWSGGLCHEMLPTYKWTADSMTLNEVSPEIPEGVQEIRLDVSNEKNEQRTGILSIGSTIDNPMFEQYLISADELSLELRRNQEELPFDGQIGERQALRIRANVSQSVSMQWMTAFGHGTLLEVDPHTVDFFPENIHFEEGEVVERSPLDFTQYQILALAMNGTGGNRWHWIGVQQEVSGLTHPYGWGLSVPDTGNPTGLVEVTVGLNESRNAFEFLDPVWVNGLDSQDHSCWNISEPFQLDWVLDGHCTCSDVLNRRVVFEVLQ